MAERDYLEHVSATGDRWDLLAARYYGDATRYAPIIEANPELVLTAVLPSGVTVRIPIVAAPAPDVSDLPPWKR